VHHIHTILHTALRQAVKWGYVSRNVTEAVDPPAVPRTEMRFLNPEQVAALLDAARDDRLEALWAVAIHTGCREGELLGLRWEDVDWHASTVFVQRTLTGTKGGVPAFAEPKTARGRRVIPLPEEAVTALRAHRVRQHAERLALGPDYADHGLVFPTQLGTPLRARNVVKTFKLLLARAGLPTEVRVHDLRHTAAALLLGEGTDVATAAAILGHTQPSTTLNVYGHAIPSNLRTATDRVGRTIRQARVRRLQRPDGDSTEAAEDRG
jgi:integrase